MELPAEIQLAIEREIAKVRSEARQEAEKARNQAMGVLAFGVLLLSLASALGVSAMIKSYSSEAAKEAVKKSMAKEFMVRANRAVSDAEASSARIRSDMKEVKKRLSDAASDAEISSARTREYMNEAKKSLSDFKDVEDWHEGSLELGWRPFSKEPGAYNPPGYFRDAFGIVHLRGLVEGGRGTIFVLPVGYRPSFRQLFVVEVSPSVAGRVDVTPTGEVILVVGDVTWVSLDSISFRIDRP